MDATAYCVDWGQAQTTLPFGAIDAALPGVAATELTYHASAASDLGIVIAGADASRRDKVVLYTTANEVVAIQADAGFPNGIFRALAADPLPQSDTFLGRPLVRMPDAIFQSSHTGTSTGDSLEKVLLAITAGTDVTFSGIPGSATNTCAFVLYDDTNFATQVFPAPLNPSASSQTLAINPADPGWPFATTVLGSTTVYLVPVETQSPANGDCVALIHGAPIAERVARNHAATPAAGAIFRNGLPEGTNLLAGGLARLPQRLEYFTFTRGDMPLEPFLLNGTMTTTVTASSALAPTTPFDPLHLKGATREATVLSVSGHALSVFPSTAAKFGWGPFTSENRTTGTLIAVPGDVPISVDSPGARTHFSLLIASPERIAIWTDGGIATLGTLSDAGTIVATSAGGSSDGVGFRMELDLPSGNYALEIQSSAGDFALHTATVAGPGDFVDAGLHTCMTEAGWAFNGTQPVTAARCAGRNIQALDGIDAALGLELVDLGRNVVTDLTPLGSLPDLHTLSLASNPVTDLTPLVGLARLRHLSLAHTAITATALADVQGALASQLAVLDLTGATDISTDDLLNIRAGFPATTIISPDGTVMP